MYTINGFIKDNSKFLSNAKVYVYFEKIDPLSYDSKWATPNYVTSSVGYYSVTLEDNQWLGINATYRRNVDKIWVAVVYNPLGNATLNSNITHAAFHVHTIGTSDVNQISLTLEPIRIPILSTYSFPDSLYTSTTYTMSEKSNADYSYKSLAPYNTLAGQVNQYNSVDIFPEHIMEPTEYTWDSNAIGGTRNKPNSTSDTYIYTKAGIYEQKIKVKEKWGTFVEVTNNVTIKYNEPTVDFDYNPKLTNTWDGNKIKGTEEITLTNTSSDKDERTKSVYSYEWIISDKNPDGTDNTKIYTGNFNVSPKHKFASPGDKDITLILYWNDGFEDKQKQIIKTLTIDEFKIIPDFKWSKVPRHRDDLITLTFSGSGDVNNIVSYKWIIEDNYPAPEENLYTFQQGETSVFGNESPDNTKRVDNTYIIETTENNVKVRFHSFEYKNISLDITYFDGWKNVTVNSVKTLQPLKQTVIPDFSIDKIPKGRDDKVTFNNTTNYMFGVINLAYNVDWKVEDFYMVGNLDYLDGKDNTKNYFDVSYNTVIEHYFQNDSTNNITLTIRYDDGWQMVTEKITKDVTPTVYSGIIPDFTFNIPNSRFEEVIIKNLNTDRLRSIKYIINDSFNEYNPDNTNYGSLLDNTKTITSVGEDVIHKFQNYIDSIIEMFYYYDDGFVERVLSKSKVISKNIKTFIPSFTSSPLDENGCFVGKINIDFINNSLLPQEIKVLEETWLINDRVLDSDNIVSRLKQEPFIPQSYTFTTPSRRPFSSIEGKDDVLSKNKNISLIIRVDNGWVNDNLDKSIDDLVYYNIEKNYEASPYELESEISVEYNVDGYEH